MRITLIGPDGVLTEEIADRLAENDHDVIDVDPEAVDDPGSIPGEVDVIIDVDEPLRAQAPGAGAAWARGVDGARDRQRAERLATVIEQSRPERYVLVSSVLVYAPVPDPADWPIREQFPRRPHGDPASRAYGLACIAAEDRLVDEARRNRCEYVVLRPTVIAGARDAFADRVLADLAEQPWQVASRYAPAGTMQWVDLADAVDAVLLAAEVPAAADQVFTIAGPDAFTAADLTAVAVGDLADLEDVSDPKYDITKAATVLGWAPRIQIDPIGRPGGWRGRADGVGRVGRLGRAGRVGRVGRVAAPWWSTGWRGGRW